MNRQQELSSALRRNAGVSGRAEDLKNYLQLYVDAGDSAILQTNANQLIVGRRGTGKTHLLNAVNDSINAQFPEARVRAFYYSAEAFRKSGEFGRTSDPSIREKTQVYFQAFVEKLANDIFALADEVFDKPTLLQELGLKGDDQRPKRDRLTDVVLRLQEVARYGTEVYSPDVVSRTHMETVLRDREKSIGISATAGLESTAGRIQGEYSRTTRGTTEDRTSVTPRRAFDAAAIRALIVESVELLGLEYIIVMIDEWTSLKGCQVEFAERLRQCLFGESRVSVKIATDQYQGKLNNGEIGQRFSGLEIGADIFAAVDLDKPFRDRSNWEPLYGEALYRRLLLHQPSLADYYGASLADPHSFVTDIFGATAFEEVARGAQGNCRDFHETVQSAAKKVAWDVTRERIPFHVVREVLSEQSDAVFESISKGPLERLLLSEIVIPHVRSNGAQLFLVHVSQLNFLDILDDLTMKRLIHPLPHSRMDPEIRANYRAYEIDYSMFIELVHDGEYSAHGAVKARANDTVRITKDSALKYSVDLAPLGIENHGVGVNCPHCGVHFLSTDRSYVKKRLCPDCLESIPDGNK